MLVKKIRPNLEHIVAKRLVEQIRKEIDRNILNKLGYYVTKKDWK